MTNTVERESRPAGNQAAITKIHGGESGSIIEPDHAGEPAIRCRACRHPLRAEKSVERGIGPVCHRAELGGESR